MNNSDPTMLQTLKDTFRIRIIIWHINSSKNSIAIPTCFVV